MALVYQTSREARESRRGPDAKFGQPLDAYKLWAHDQLIEENPAMQ